MSRVCSIHGGMVADTNAELIDAREVGSGPPIAVYACHECVRDRGIVPRAQAAFIGHRDAPPAPAGEAP